MEDNYNDLEAFLDCDENGDLCFRIIKKNQKKKVKRKKHKK